MHIYFFLLFLSIFVGCSTSSVTVNRYPVLPQDLPSAYIESPDPLLKNPPIGQVLDVKYRLKNLKKEEIPYLLVLKVIYKNLDEETISHAVFKEKGSFEFSCIDDKYESTGGILTYKADLTTFDGEPIAEFKHKLWFELISFE